MRRDGRVMSGEIITFYHTRDSDRCSCTVRIHDDDLVIGYDDVTAAGGKVIYKGRQVADGRWMLECPTIKGIATLNVSARDPNCLEGTWCENGEIGMWQIDVEDDDED